MYDLDVSIQDMKAMRCPLACSLSYRDETRSALSHETRGVMEGGNPEARHEKDHVTEDNQFAPPEHGCKGPWESEAVRPLQRDPSVPELCDIHVVVAFILAPQLIQFYAPLMYGYLFHSVFKLQPYQENPNWQYSDPIAISTKLAVTNHLFWAMTGFTLAWTPKPSTGTHKSSYIWSKWRSMGSVIPDHPLNLPK